MPPKLSSKLGGHVTRESDLCLGRHHPGSSEMEQPNGYISWNPI